MNYSLLQEFTPEVIYAFGLRYVILGLCLAILVKRIPPSTQPNKIAGKSIGVFIALLLAYYGMDIIPYKPLLSGAFTLIPSIYFVTAAYA